MFHEFLFVTVSGGGTCGILVQDQRHKQVICGEDASDTGVLSLYP